MTDIIQQTRQYIKRRFLTELEPKRGRYRYTHTLRVTALGQKIARAEGLDEEMLILACLLHDIGYVACKTDEEFADHGRVSADIAAEYLRDTGYDPAKAEQVCYGVRIHTLEDEKLPRKPTASEASVADADNIDRFDAWRLYEGMAGLDPEALSCTELLEAAKRRVKGHEGLRDYPFATPTAQRLWQDRLDLCVSYYSHLAAQMEATLVWDAHPEIRK